MYLIWDLKKWGRVRMANLILFQRMILNLFQNNLSRNLIVLLLIFLMISLSLMEILKLLKNNWYNGPSWRLSLSSWISTRSGTGPNNVMVSLFTPTVCIMQCFGSGSFGPDPDRTFFHESGFRQWPFPHIIIGTVFS